MRRTNREHAVCFRDIEQAIQKSPETYGRLDLLCGGWPCQDNSIAGTRKGHKGEKSGLWEHIARCLRLFKPKWFLGENVPGFLSVNDGQDFLAVIAELMEIGYGLSWRILDSQYFGVAQKRRRLFIVGSFGRVCPPEILFEQEGGGRNPEKDSQARTVGLCISTRDGERQDPSNENIIASTIIASDYKKVAHGQYGNEKNLVAKTLLTEESKLRKLTSDGGNLVAHTVGTGQRGTAGRIWEDTHVATTDTKRKRKAPRISDELVSPRGVVIGNAVTVPVAEWIGRRVMEYDNRR